MKARVHILATVRKRELLPAATLVFGTLRAGFPRAEVSVWGNALPDYAAAEVARTAAGCRAEFRNVAYRPHDQWIEWLVFHEAAPFWIVDTDVVFFGRLEGWRAPVFGGRLEPEFLEEWTNTVHVERLHTAVMYLDGRAIRERMRMYQSQYPEPWGVTAQHPLIRQHFIPRRNQLPLFYDSMAGLYHALEGTAFGPEQNEAFEHLHCGTYADLVGAETESLKGLPELHGMVYEDPARARGIQVEQAAYYERRNVCRTIQG